MGLGKQKKKSQCVRHPNDSETLGEVRLLNGQRVILPRWWFQQTVHYSLWMKCCLLYVHLCARYMDWKPVRASLPVCSPPEEGWQGRTWRAGSGLTAGALCRVLLAVWGAHSPPGVGRGGKLGRGWGGFLLQPAALIFALLKARCTSVHIAKQHVGSTVSSLA